MTKNKSAHVEPMAEDSVECLIFPCSSETDTLVWKELCVLLNTSIKNLSLDYIWHKDEFKVYLPIEHHKADIPCHIASSTCFGDNVEDEWFIVHLVLELSKHFPDYVFQLKDNDGDFLLIEAADYLPSWANPESTENRVFIYRNQVHLIPITMIDVDSKLKIEDAIKLIASAPEKTKVSNEIQQAILHRIGIYPDNVKKGFHKTIVKLPMNIATLLALKPALISPIVNAYCNHDFLDIQACSNIKYDDCIDVEVKFTKCLYAMLLHAKLPKSIKFVDIDDKKSIVGQKVSLGYEILMSKPLKDIFASKEFSKFMSKLNTSGYFHNNIEGSSNYNLLLENAKHFFSVMECPINSQVSSEISQLTKSVEFVEMGNKLKQTGANSDLIEDSEDWLNINPEQLNDLLNSRYGKKAKFHKNDILNAQNVTSELLSFLMKTSDFEGIESNENIVNPNVEFDPEEFVKSVEKMLNIISIGSDNSEEHSESDNDYMSDGEESDDIENDNLQNSKTILHNIIQSMKEEGFSGPSSNLMKSVGFSKTELLDSDDDE